MFFTPSIVFKNPGLIDLRCLRNFGVSAKPNSDNPIGKFGSGLKVAVCILLRLRCSVTLYRGMDRYTFGTKPVEIRGKMFDFITMTHPDGTEEEMPFNTHVGEHWADWTPFRELHSNVLDEGGETIRLNGRQEYTPVENQTAFVIKGDAIDAAYGQRHTIFLTSAPILADQNVEVHSGPSDYAYYRGVRVLKLRRPSIYTYNLLHSLFGLTEDRTLKSESDLDYYVSKMLETCEDEAFMRALMLSPNHSFEHHMTVHADEASSPFINLYSRLRKEGQILHLTPWSSNLYLKTEKTFPLPPPVSLNRIQEIQLKRALDFCDKAGFHIKDTYPVVVISHAPGGGWLGLAQDGKIILTLQAFDQGVKELVNTILEEYFHLKHSLRDETREMQTFLLRQMVNMAELVTGEAL
jgi:hypothetical protein